MRRRDDRARFDEAYYARFYGETEARIHGPDEVAHLGEWLFSVVAFYGGSLRSVLEVGAGVGHLRDWFRGARPKVRYRSIELSPYAAARFGHEARDITTWKARGRFDLVVCQGVLPYLTAPDALRAIDNIAAMSRGFLYLEAITRRDYDAACDQERTDPAMYLRSASFYRRALAPHFRSLGSGLFYARSGPLVFWELEEGHA